MTGGFTGAGSVPAVDMPMMLAMPAAVNTPKKKKSKSVKVHEAAMRLVQHLLDEDQEAPRNGDGTGRYA